MSLVIAARRRGAAVGVLAGAALLASAPTRACPVPIDASSFAAAVSFAAGTEPYYLAVADLDGDGRDDVAAADHAHAVVTVLRNTSTPGVIDLTSFTPALSVLVGNTPFGVAATDLDGDGRADLVSADSGDNTVSVLRNTSTLGSISFAPRLALVAGGHPWGVALADIDGDGKSDVVVMHFFSSFFSVYRNTSTLGSISFAPRVDVATASGGREVAVADVDGDGRNDVAAALNGAGRFSVFRSTSATGSISFAAPVDLAATGDPYGVALEDIDGDGRADFLGSERLAPDLVTARNTSTTGSISFAPMTGWSTPGGPRAVAAGDINLDGRPDVAVATYSGNVVSVFENASSIGSISLAPRVDFPSGANPIGAVLADVDGDGRLDLGVAESADSTVSWFWNAVDTTCATICGSKFFDQNGNGVRDAGEPGLSAWPIQASGPLSLGTLTDAVGDYCLGGLPPGVYTVSETVSPPWTQTYPSGSGTHVVSVAAGQTLNGIDFGNELTTCVGPPPGMVGWWTFVEGSGTTAMDWGGAPNDLSLVGGPVWVPGPVGWALQFDGLNDHGETPDDPELDIGTNDLTIDAWILPSYNVSVGPMRILSKEGGGAPGGYAMALEALGPNTISVGFNATAGGGGSWWSPAVLLGSGWHHVAVTVQPGAVDGIRFYVDGTLAGTADASALTGSFANSSPLRIGQAGPGLPFVDRYDGLLDEVELYDRALAASEVQLLWAAGSYGKCTPVGVAPPQSRPASLALYQNRPNPFRGATTIAYELARPALVTLSIYDVRGVLVRRLERGVRPAGRYRAGWDGRDAAGHDVAAGVYFYRLEAGPAQTRRMLLLR